MKVILQLVLTTVLSLILSHSYAYQYEFDSVLIKSYGAGNYKATAYNYAGLETPEGILYFANESGVLEFDGSEWRLINLDDFSAAFVLKQHADGTIYVGGLNEFGYLKKDSLGFMTYQSLREQLNSKDPLTEFWQIVIIDDDIYFECFQKIIRWDGDQLHSIKVKDAVIFKIEDRLYTSVYGKGLGRIIDDSVHFINEKFKFENDVVFDHNTGPEGQILLFTTENGIYIFNEETFSTQKWQSAEYYEKYDLYDVVKWKDSTFICSTWENGLIFLDMNGKIVKHFDTKAGLASNTTREIFIDNRNNIWVTTAHGLSYLTFQDSSQFIPEVKVRYVTMDDTPVSLEYFQKNYATVSSSNAISFHYATPGYDKNELEYSYFLDGYETDFSGWKSDFKKEYTNLDGGNYTFNVKAKLSNGVITEPAVVKFFVPRPWYRNKWILASSGMLLALIVILSVRWRTARLKHLNKRLEKIITSRTRELIEQRERLKTTNKELKTINAELDNFVYRSSHDLVAPLKSLKGLIHIARLETKDDHQEEYLRLMNSSVLKLEEFIKSIMEYSTNTKSSVVHTDVHLDELLDSIVDDLKYYDRAERVKLIRTYENECFFKSDPKRLKIIFSNLITNSIKYHDYDKPDPFIEVKAHRDNGLIQIEIIDNGQGIDQEHLDKIFEMFFRASNISEGSGLGLYIVKDTVEKLGGNISVQSKPGIGTKFSLRFSN